MTTTGTVGRLRLWGGPLPSLVDVGLAVLGGLSVPLLAATTAIGLLPGSTAAPVVGVVVGLALLAHRRLPLLAVIASLASFALVGAAVPVSIAGLTAASAWGNRWPTWAATASAVGVLMAPWGVPAGDADPWFGVVYGCAFVGLPVVFGLWIAQRRELFAALRERAEQAERERDLRAGGAVADERARIARELHDVVAHRVSQITVQAGALAVSADGIAADVAEAIRGTSATALEEMRELLGVLRRDDGAVPLHPAPTLAGLRTLVDGASAAGQRVRANLPYQPPSVDGSTERAVYRVVQEALTNAGKHARCATVDVEVLVEPGRLIVRVRNGPGERAPGVAGSGYGLVGMGERVTLAGGTLTTGALAGGGFMVLAEFPLKEAT